MEHRRFGPLTRPFGLTLFLCAAVCYPIAPMAQSNSDNSGKVATPPTPPVAPVRPVTTDYYGMTVVDPYRYIENLQDPQVDAWFKAENAYTRGILAKIPGRDALLARIRELDASTPAKVSDVNRIPGGRYFYEKMLPNEIVSR